jgi:enoyl-CoA hydratase
VNAPSAVPTGQLIARKEGAIGWLIISNTAKLNAISFDMWTAMPKALAAFAADSEIRMVVLTGEGDKAFASGADISQFDQHRSSGDALAQYNRTLVEATNALLDFPKPTLAKVRGICIGGGLALSLNCDLRFCADDAVFRMPAARLGLGYEYAGIKRMVEVIGAANASDLFFSARKFGAEEAVRMGLVTRVSRAADFDTEFAQYCALIAENAPLTMAAAKLAIRESGKDAASRDMAQVESMYRACFSSEDYAEGRRAFMEKRTPRFRGV